MQDIVTAGILGLLEGATEFLPVSSTGHLILVGDLLGFTGERAKTFEIFIQLGAIAALVFHYRVKIWDTILRVLKLEPTALTFTASLIVGVFPALLLGAGLHGFIKAHLFSPLTVAAALLVGGVAILVIERMKRRVVHEAADALPIKTAALIGLCQCLALFPGVSRSGATIMGGLLCGLSRPAAAEFSFFLSIPTMIAATLFAMISHDEPFQAADAPMFAVGFAAAFASALVVVRLFLSYVSRHDFTAFAWYRIVLGGAVLAYFTL